MSEETDEEIDERMSYYIEQSLYREKEFQEGLAAINEKYEKRRAEIQKNYDREMKKINIISLFCMIMGLILVLVLAATGQS
jgi:hypothetical protein